MQENNSAAKFLYSAFKGLRTQCEVYSRSPSPVAVPHRSQPLWELAAETSDVIVSVDLPHSLARPPGPHVGDLQPRNHFRPQHLHLPPKPCDSGFMKEHRSEPSWNQVPAWPVRWIRRCAPCGIKSEPAGNRHPLSPCGGSASEPDAEPDWNQAGTRRPRGLCGGFGSAHRAEPGRNQVGTRLEPGIRLACVALSRRYPIAPVDLFKILNKQRVPGAGRGGGAPSRFLEFYNGA